LVAGDVLAISRSVSIHTVVLLDLGRLRFSGSIVSGFLFLISGRKLWPRGPVLSITATERTLNTE